MYPNSAVFGIIFALLFAVSMVIGTLIAIKRGFIPALVRLGMIILCLLISIPLTTAIAGQFSGIAENIMHSLLGSTMDQIAQYSPSTIQLLRQFPIALIAPILFLAIFYLLKLVTLIVFRLSKPILPSHSTLTFRILGGVAGAVSALICLWALWIPLWGMIGIVHNTAQTLSEVDTTQNAQLDATMTQIEQIDTTILGPAVDNFTVELFTDRGNSGLYNGMTKIELNDEKLYLGEEITQLSHTALDALNFVGSLPNDFQLTDLTRDHVNSLRTLSADIDNSEMLKNICAEWLSAMAQTWKSNEQFMGMNDPANKTKIKPVIHALYGLLSTTNAEILIDDLNIFINLLDVLLDHKVISSQQTDLVKTVGNDAFVNDLTASLSSHNRLLTSLSELTSSTTGAWANGTDYMGMAEPNMNAEYRSMIHACYGFLATTTDAFLVEDIKTLSGLAAMLTQKTSAPNILLDDGFLKEFNQFLGEHTRFRGFFTGWMTALAASWADGNAYEGIAVPASNELLTPVMTSIYEILATTDETLIHDDLSALTEIMEIMRSYEVFNNAKEGYQMADILMKSNFVSDLTNTINRHERFKPLLDVVASLGLSAISSQLTVALPDAPMMTDLSGKISTTLNSVTGQSETVRLDSIQSEISKVLTENKVNVPDGVTDMISQIVNNQFGNRTTVTEKEVTDYLTELYNSTGNLDGFFK